jgi:hypothetical protein
MKLSKLALLVGLTSVLLGCSTSLKSYEDTGPEFDLRGYFDGQSVAWGTLIDYSNKLTRTFCVEIDASWQVENGKHIGTLNENFYFDDGERSNRIWKIQDNSDGTYSGAAGDVIGKAKGESKGRAFHWQYDLEVKVGERDMVFAMDDWMYRVDEHRLFNKTAMEKLGVEVATITLFFDKQDQSRRCLENNAGKTN